MGKTLVEAFDAAEKLAASLGRYANPASVPPEVARVRDERAAVELARHGAAAGIEPDELSRMVGRAWAREVDRGHRG